MSWNCSCENTLDPYVISYPLVTTMGRKSDAFDMNEALLTKYLIKFRPGTIGRYKFTVWETNKATGAATKMLKLCR